MENITPNPEEAADLLVRGRFGWTLTGVIGSLPFLAGYLWDRRR